MPTGMVVLLDVLYFWGAVRDPRGLRSAVAAVAALTAAGGDQQPRRFVTSVTRAMGKWRGSTVQGYVVHGDESTYLLNFCCSGSG